MARPQKEGLDYFPLDVDFFSDTKIRILQGAYGNDGIALYMYLLTKIYKNGYYLAINEDVLELAAADVGISLDSTRQIVAYLAKRSLFDYTLFSSVTVLTSPGIQRRFQLGVRTRAKKTAVTVKGEYWLLEKDETEPFILVQPNSNSSWKNDDNSRKNDDCSREESLKKSKEKEIPSGGVPSGDDGGETAVIFLPLRDGTEYMVFPRQVTQWEELYPAVNILQELKKMRGWLMANPARQKTPGGILRFITGWLAREQRGATPRPAVSKPEPPPNRFNDFPQREYDFDEIERQFRCN